MENQTNKSAKAYFNSKAVMTLPRVGINNSSASDFRQIVLAQVGNCLDYGFPVGDHLGGMVTRICSTIGRPFKLGDVDHPEATLSLLADLVQLGAMKLEKDVYEWIPPIVGKWRHTDFNAGAHNSDQRLATKVRVGPALTTESATFARSLPPSMLSEFHGEGGTHVLYIPDMEGQLSGLQKGKLKDVDENTKPMTGLFSQNLIAAVHKTLRVSHRPIAVFIDNHVVLTNDPQRLIELFHAAMPVAGTELSRFWYDTRAKKSHFVGGKSGSVPDKKKAKLEALLA